MYANDPSSDAELVWTSTNATAIANGVSAKLADGSRIDVGHYDHVLILVLGMGGTGGASLIPRSSSSQSGTETVYDGTNGNPDFSRRFLGPVGGCLAISLRVNQLAGRFLNLEVIAGVGTGVTAGTFRPGIVVLGFGLRAKSINRGIDSAVAVNIA